MILSRARSWLVRYPLAPATVLALLVWEAASFLLVSSGDRLARSKLPPPHEVLLRLVDDRHLLLEALWETGRGALIGLAFGTIIGAAIALWLSTARWLEDAIYPYVIAAQMIPTVALAPILLAILRNPTATRVIVATYITFFSVTVTTLRGLKSADPESRELLTSLNVSRPQMYRKLLIPSSMPFFFAGFKIAAPLSVVGQIIVELTGATSGLGYTILVSQYYGPSFAPLFWATMLVTLGTGFVFFKGAVLLERRLTPWQHEFHRQ